VRPRAAVFAFHDVVPADRLADVPATHRPYVLDPRDFRALLLAAAQSSRRSLPVGRVPGELGGGFFGLTFDDGCASDYEYVFPALVELHLRATFFIVPPRVDTAGHVTWAQLREMTAAGMEIGSHSMTHPFLDALDGAALRREFGDSKTLLEDRLGAAVTVASLPRGWEPPALAPVLEELGYRVFCTSRLGWWHPGDAPLSMPRIGVRRGMAVEEFAAIVDAQRGALWRLQTVEAAKNAAKACLGRRGWNRVRAPLLELFYRDGDQR
jgi:peptidoglycan/xylan/chitin deacetylase (PgdA/CDA1 family)